MRWGVAGDTGTLPELAIQNAPIKAKSVRKHAVSCAGLFPPPARESRTAAGAVGGSGCLRVCSQPSHHFYGCSGLQFTPGTANAFKTLKNSLHTGGRSSSEKYLD